MVKFGEYFCFQIIKRTSQPLPEWGPANPEDRTGRYAIVDQLTQAQEEHKRPPSVISYTNSFANLPTLSNGFDPNVGTLSSSSVKHNGSVDIPMEPMYATVDRTSSYKAPVRDSPRAAAASSSSHKVPDSPRSAASSSGSNKAAEFNLMDGNSSNSGSITVKAETHSSGAGSEAGSGAGSGASQGQNNPAFQPDNMNENTTAF